MSAFAREFLRDRFEDETRPRGFLALFGKHPGWDDHVEDLPLATSSLVLAKQILYVQGIGGQVGSGGWARLDDAKRLPEFDHGLLWARGAQFLLGRLWASTDGKRRAHFPMIAMVHCVNLPVGPTLHAILSWLESVEAACKATRSAERVRALFQQCQEDFQGWVERTDHASPETSATCDWGITAETLLPAVSLLRGKVADLMPARFRERNPLTPVSLRVPAAGRDAALDLRLWNRLLTRLLHEDVPRLLTAPRERPWLDIVAGEPGTPEAFPLRASNNGLPISGAAGAEQASDDMEASAIIQAALDPAAELHEDEPMPEPRGWFARLLQSREEAP